MKSTKPSQAIACLGLSYKSDIDDLRESPALNIVEKLATKHSGKIFVAEPNITILPKQLEIFKNIVYCNFEEAIDHADTIIILTDHTDFKRVKNSKLKDKNIIDTRGIW